LQTRIDDFRSLDTEILAVCVDPVENNKEVSDAYGLEYAVLSDPDLSVIDAYGVRHPGGYIDGDIARPATFIIDRGGGIVWRDVTENWRVRVRPEQLLDQLATLP
jgi:peroxiredoxin